MRRRFTNSELTTWRRCRRKWWLAHWRKLAPKTQHLNLNRETGTIVHDVLAHAYNNAWEIDIKAAVAYSTYAMQENAHDPECEICIKTTNEITELSILMVEGYKQWLAEEGADSDYEFIAQEEAVSYVPEGWPWDVELLGLIDSKFKRISDSASLFRDHKTVQNFTDLPKTAHLDTQFKFYHMLERATSKERTDGIELNMLKRVKRTSRAKPPFYKRHEVRHDDSTMESFWYQVFETVSDIMKTEDRLSRANTEGKPENFMYPTPTKDCSWDCDFFPVCPMFDSGEDAEDFLATAYIEIDPLVRYA